MNTDKVVGRRLVAAGIVLFVILPKQKSRCKAGFEPLNQERLCLCLQVYQDDHVETVSAGST